MWRTAAHRCMSLHAVTHSLDQPRRLGSRVVGQSCCAKEIFSWAYDAYNVVMNDCGYASACYMVLHRTRSSKLHGITQASIVRFTQARDTKVQLVVQQITLRAMATNSRCKQVEVNHSAAIIGGAPPSGSRCVQASPTSPSSVRPQPAGIQVRIDSMFG